MRRCARCEVDKPLAAFTTGSRGRPHSWCRSCNNEYRRGKPSYAYRNETPEQRRDRNMRRRYGLTADQVDAMIEGQGGLCAICQAPAEKPVVDHCHDTGAVRGILCHGCNIKLPAVEDAEFVFRARAYLGEFR